MDKLLYYDIARQLGEGKHGPTWLAMDAGHQRPVVIKRLDHPSTTTEAWLRGWQAHFERRTVLTDLNLVKLCSLEEVDGRRYLIREYVEGNDLASWIEAGLPPSAKIMSIATTLTNQLKVLHDHDLVHGNLSPGNVIVDGCGRATLVDDGLGLSASALDTQQQWPAGELACLAPELLAGVPPGMSTDHYALGALLFFMWTGQPVFPEDAVETMKRAISSEPVSFELHPARQVPGVARLVIAKLLEKDPTERFISTDELQFTLQGMLELGSEPEAPKTRRQWSPSHRQYLMISILAMLLAIFWLVITGDRP